MYDYCLAACLRTCPEEEASHTTFSSYQGAFLAKIRTLITHKHLQHIHHVIHFCIVAKHIRRGERISYFVSIFP